MRKSHRGERKWIKHTDERRDRDIDKTYAMIEQQHRRNGNQQRTTYAYHSKTYAHIVGFTHTPIVGLLHQNCIPSNQAPFQLFNGSAASRCQILLFLH